MKLFGNFEAVKFPEENMILVTKDGFLYYSYRAKYDSWSKYCNAGNDQLTVSNYPDVTRWELANAMHGVLPKGNIDFIRLCRPSQLSIGDMLDLLIADYPRYMSDYTIRNIVHKLLLESDLCCKSFEKLQKLLDDATSHRRDNVLVSDQIKDLSLAITGRDIFRNEIGIVDGHNGSSYFWIMPVRVVDNSNTNSIDNVAEMRSAEISIEEDDVALYLTQFLYHYYDDELEANQQRVGDAWIDKNGNEQRAAVRGFEWNLTHNYFTPDSIEKMLADINDTVDALSTGRENEYTKILREKRRDFIWWPEYAQDQCDESITTDEVECPIEDSIETEPILDFYRRFLYRMEYMLRVGKEKGYDLISFMGP